MALRRALHRAGCTPPLSNLSSNNSLITSTISDLGPYSQPARSLASLSTFLSTYYHNLATPYTAKTSSATLLQLSSFPAVGSNTNTPPHHHSASCFFPHTQQHKHLHTTTQTLANEPDEFNLISLDSRLIRIEGYDDTGFIVNDVQLDGAVLCYNDMFLLWNIDAFSDVSIESLALLDILKPAPDLLIIGCGKHIQPLPQPLVNELQQRRVNFEVLDTVNAVATFNILNQEGRNVVGALLPLGSV